MIGIFYGHAIFWTVFLICYGVAIIMVSFILYFSTQMKVGKEDVSKEHKKLLKQLTTFKEENTPSSKSTWKLNLLGMIRIVTTLWDVRTEEGRWDIYYHPSFHLFLVYFTCDLGNFGETTLVNPKLFSSSYFKFSILASLFLVQYRRQVSLKERRIFNAI